MSSPYPSLEVWRYGGAGEPTLIYSFDSKAAGRSPADLMGQPWVITIPCLFELRSLSSRCSCSSSDWLFSPGL